MSLHTKACILIITFIALACTLTLLLGLWMIAQLPAEMPRAPMLISNFQALWWVLITTSFGKGVLISVDTAQSATARHRSATFEKEN